MLASQGQYYSTISSLEGDDTEINFEPNAELGSDFFPLQFGDDWSWLVFPGFYKQGKKKALAKPYTHTHNHARIVHCKIQPNC